MLKRVVLSLRMAIVVEAAVVAQLPAPVMMPEKLLHPGPINGWNRR